MKNLNMDTLNDMLGALSTRKRPCDMEDILDHKVYSKSQDEWIRIGDMALEHVLRKYYLLLNNDKFDKKLNDVGLELSVKIENLENIIQEKDDIIDKVAMSEKKWKERFFEEVTLKGHVMMFKDIPNDESGRAFIEQMKKHLNKDSYKIRVKGQYLIDGEDWKRYSYGQPISKSKCLRVYVYKQ
tara:strand:+ start:569 stop:1120 length:552 start_codon:yes stop_codon:yes gene_type:complete